MTASPAVDESFLLDEGFQRRHKKLDFFGWIWYNDIEYEINVGTFAYESDFAYF